MEHREHKTPPRKNHSLAPLMALLRLLRLRAHRLPWLLTPARQPVTARVRAALLGGVARACAPQRPTPSVEDFTALEEQVRIARDDADAQRRLAQNFSEAFASKPDQQLADGLEDYIAELKTENTRAWQQVEKLTADLTLATQATAATGEEER